MEETIDADIAKQNRKQTVRQKAAGKSVAEIDFGGALSVYAVFPVGRTERNRADGNTGGVGG